MGQHLLCGNLSLGIKLWPPSPLALQFKDNLNLVNSEDIAILGPLQHQGVQYYI